MKIREVIEIIEEKYPLSLQADFDNSGLKCGNVNSNLSGILITLDTNLEIIEEAKSKNCNLIIEHHPTIFNPLYELDFNNPKTNILFHCLKNDICLYSAHTNVDFATDGLNDYFLKQLLCVPTEASLIEPTRCFRVGMLEKETNLRTYVEQLQLIFNEKLLFFGDENKIIKTVACSNGAAGNENNVFLTNTIADVFISSEFKHSALMLAKTLNYAIIQLSHFATESGFLDLIFKMLIQKVNHDIVFKSKLNSNPLRGLET